MARRIFDYESRRQPLAPRRRFIRRLALSLAAAALLVGLSLGAGMLGFVYFENMSWIDAFLNAAMTLGGMGPVHPLNADPVLLSGVHLERLRHDGGPEGSAVLSNCTCPLVNGLQGLSRTDRAPASSSWPATPSTRASS